ncbi:MAG: LamG-like jellyroll fold domain-containing protein [Candidatus Pacearchaeota archaeon]
MNEKIRKLEERKLKLLKNIDYTKKKKQEIIDFTQKLVGEYIKGRISRAQYESQLSKTLNNKTPEQWVRYYEEYIESYEKQIDICDKEIKKEKSRRINNKTVSVLLIGIVLVSLILFIFSSYFFGPAIINKFSGISQGTQTSLSQAQNEIQTPELLPEQAIPAEELALTGVFMNGQDISSSVKQFPAVAGMPVRWKAKVDLNENSALVLPNEAENIVVKENGKEVTNEISVDKKSFLGIFNKRTEVSVTDSDNYEINYETPAPQISAENFENRGAIKISGPDNLGYTNVLSYVEIPGQLKMSEINKLKFYWIKNGIRTEHKYVAYDLNEDGFVDTIEWITPHLSEQTFEWIIEISNAEHLDSNKEFISDIYEQVKEQDDIWSEQINNNEYVRVRFRQALDNTRDITIYARKTGSDESEKSTIEVYSENGNNLIARFENINQENWYKIYLNNLPGGESYDVFDLKIIGNVEFDYIVDPIVIPSYSEQLISEGNFYHLNISNSAPYNQLYLYHNFDVDGTNIPSWDNKGTPDSTFGAVYNSSGLYGGARTFNGNTYLSNLRTELQFSNPGQYTWMMWIKRSSLTNKEALFNFAFSRAWDAGGSITIGSVLEDDKLYFNNLYGGDYIRSSGTIEGGWTHVAVSYNNGAIALYINGNQDGSGTLNCMGSEGYDLNIGGDSFGALDYNANEGIYFKGEMDEVMVFRSALTSTQISDIYKNQSNRFIISGSQNFGNQSLLNISGSPISVLGDYKNISSYINLSVGYYTGQWYSTNTQVFNGDNLFDTHPLSTNLTLNFTFYSGSNNGNYNFYSPILFSDVDVSKGSVDTTPPAINFTYPTPANASKIYADNFVVNVSASDVGKGDNNISTFIDFNRSLVGWWRMDDVNGNIVYDNSNYGNDLSVRNGAYQTNGFLGNGFGFDGVDDVLVNNSKINGLAIGGGNATISVYAKINQDYDVFKGIFEYGRASGDSYGIWRNASDTFHCRFGYGGAANWQDTIDSVQMFYPNQWYHILCTMQDIGNGNFEYKIYINGKLDNTKVRIPNSWISLEKSLAIGAYGYGDGELFNGTIDEVMIFKRVLNENEIKTLYANYTAKNLSVSFNNLKIGNNYTFKAYSQDIKGNVNLTEKREVEISAPGDLIADCSGTDPYTNQDWIIKDNTLCENVNIKLSQDRILAMYEGGNLTLKNVSLTLDPSSDKFLIYVEDNSKINITNSKINSTGNRYAIRANNNSNTYISDSIFYDMGASNAQPYQGVINAYDNVYVLIKNNSFFNIGGIFKYSGALTGPTQRIFLYNNQVINYSSDCIRSYYGKGIVVENLSCYNGALYGSGIRLQYYNSNLTFKNINITNIIDDGIVILDGADNLSFENINLINVSDLRHQGYHGSGVNLYQNTGNITDILFKNIFSTVNDITSEDGIDEAVQIGNGGVGKILNVTFIGCNFSSVGSYPVGVNAKDSYINFINTSLNSDLGNKFSYESTSKNVTINVKWYYWGYAKDEIGFPVQGVNISAFNKSNNLQFSSLTNGNGLVNKELIDFIDFVNGSGSQNRSYYSNYTINASYLDYPNKTISHNMTYEHNVYDEFVFLIPDRHAPAINFTYPTPANNSIVYTDNFVVNVSASDIGRGDNNISTFIDFNRSLVGWWRMDDFCVVCGKNGRGDYLSYWKLDDSFSDGVANDEKGINNGKIYGATQIIDPQRGEVARFDASASNYINVGNNSNLEISNAISISGWIKLEGTAVTQRLVSKKVSSGAQTGFEVEIYTYSFDPRLRFYAQGNTYANAYYNWNSNPGWHHIVAVANGNEGRLYVDGVDRTTDSTIDPILSNNLNLTIGRQSGTGAAPFEGLMDDIRIYDFALTPGEVLEIYNSESNCDPGFCDYSDYGTNCLVVGGATQTSGKIGKALNFPLNSFLNCTNDLDFNITKEITLSLWVNAPSLPADNQEISILRNEESGYNLIIGNEEVDGIIAPIRFEIRNASSGTNQYQKIYSNSDISPNTWYNVIATYDGNLMKLYLNGNLNSQKLVSGKILNDNSGLIIGKGSFSDLATGLVDEVMIFKRALDENEVKALYANKTLDNLKTSFTNLSAGNYTMKAYSQDSYGNINSTEERSVKVTGLVAPEILYITPMSEVVYPDEDNGEGATATRILDKIIFGVTDGNGAIDLPNSGIIASGYIEHTPNTPYGYTDVAHTRRYFNGVDCAFRGLIEEGGKEYSCDVNIYYYDDAVDWSVNITSFKDLSGLEASNLPYSMNGAFKIGERKGVYLSENILDFGNVNKSVLPVEALTPMIIKNTGNRNVDGISKLLQFRGRDLTGETYTEQKISTENFQVNLDNPTPCSPSSQFITLTDKIDNPAGTLFNGLILHNGDLVLGDAQNNVYFCLASLIDTPLNSQTYSTIQTGDTWEINAISLFLIKLIRFNLGIILFAVGIRIKRKKKLVTEDRLLDVLESKLEDKYGINIEELLSEIKKKKEKEIEVPLIIFRKSIGPAEILCKYLRENKKLRFSEIAKLINRDERTVWINYRNAQKKIKGKIEIQKSLVIPISVLSNKKLSILESIINYLKEKDLKNSEIAEILNKDQRNIWTLYSRVKKKIK